MSAVGLRAVKLKVTASGWAHWCPGCQCLHEFTWPTWKFDGDLRAPTFAPAMEVVTYDGPKQASRCHYDLRRGELHYRDDCTHRFAGAVVELQPLPALMMNGREF